MPELTDTLCLECGLCCNGVLFADVRREGKDGSPLFKQYGARVPQPCPAFNHADCKCALYADRPKRCRQFECKQLIAVCAGEKTADAALKRIREAQKVAKEVEELLVQLGFNDVTLPFSKRFQHCQRTAEIGKLPPEDFEKLADLQLAVHRLNGLLARDFYA